MNEEGFTSFLCPSCRIEIEASLDMCGTSTECPACGAKITVPKPEPTNEIVRHGIGDEPNNRSQAMKSRTIRIELADL
ncbi:MAG: hypothetical protein J6U17_04615 [Kiritimatiellae bacterium]|nr:hypothetical protein [Kiritimatiellia bacterium]